MHTEILIEELNATESGIITESSQQGNDVYLSGVFMQADIKNRNGRNYPISEISRAVENAKNKIVESNGIFGELDHPQTLNINLDRVSHVISELNMSSNNAVGKIKLLETPMGKIGKELVRSGVLLGVSSRGAGNVNESGGVTDFNFVTIDLVATPSAPGAVPKSVFEALDMNQKGKKVLHLSEQIQQDPDAQKYLKAEIMKFLNEGLFAKK